MKRFFSLPVQLVLVLIGSFLCAPYLSTTTIQVMYSMSFVIKELLEFILPFIVFFFVSSGIMAFRSNSLFIIVLLLGMVFCSNMITALYAYFVGTGLVPFISGTQQCLVTGVTQTLSPLLSLGLRPLIASEQAMMAALVMGIMCSFNRFSFLRHCREFLFRGKTYIEWCLARLFIPVLPIYVCGFFLKMYYELPLAQLCQAYGVLFLCAIVLHWVYLFFIYTVAAQGRLQKAVAYGVTALPSYLTALGTMSSIAALPVSVVCAEKNTENKSLSEFSMPILANIHLLGDAVSVPLFALATMFLFFGSLPSLATYIVFIVYFCLTMLAVSGVPGGGIIVMLPLLKSLFGFTPEMLSVMTALYLLQDGFGTACNVMGDGALVILFHRVARYLKIA